MSKETKKSEKSLTMIVNELKVKIEKAIAESNLPACIVEPIVLNYWLQLKQTETAQLAADTAHYTADAEEGKENQ